MSLTLASWAVLATMIVIAFRALRLPGCAFALVISMYAIEHVLLQNRTGLPIGGSFTNFFVGVTTLASLIAAFMRDEIKVINLTFPMVAGYLLIFYAGLSVTWSPVPNQSIQLFVDMVPYITVIVFLAPFCINSFRNLYACCIALMIIGIFISIGLIGSEVKHRAVELISNTGQVKRANPLATGSFGGHLAIFSLYFFYRFKLNKLQQIAVLSTVAAAVFVVAQSGSRGQIVALAISSLIWVPIGAKASVGRTNLIAYATVILFAIIGYLFLEKLDLLWRFNTERIESGAMGRFDMATSLLEATYKAGPAAILFGLGNSSSYFYVGFYPHIVPLEVIAEEGIIGSLLFAIFIIGVFRNFRSTLSDRTCLVRSEACLFAGLFTFELLLSLKQGSLIGQQQLFCFGLCSFIVLPLISDNLRNARRREVLRRRSRRISAANGLIQ